MRHLHVCDILPRPLPLPIIQPLPLPLVLTVPVPLLQRHRMQRGYDHKKIPTSRMDVTNLIGSMGGCRATEINPRPSFRLPLLPTMQDLACGEDGGGAGGECKKSHDWLGIRGLVDEAVCPSGIGLLGPLDRKLVEAGRVQATCPAGWRITTHALDGTSVPQETDTVLLQDWKTSESRPSAMPMTMASFIGFRCHLSGPGDADMPSQPACNPSRDDASEPPRRRPPSRAYAL